MEGPSREEMENTMAESNFRESIMAAPETYSKAYVAPAYQQGLQKSERQPYDVQRSRGSSYGIQRSERSYSDVTGPGESMRTYQQLSYASPGGYQPYCYGVPLSAGRMRRVCVTNPISPTRSTYQVGQLDIVQSNLVF